MQTIEGCENELIVEGDTKELSKFEEKLFGRGSEITTNEAEYEKILDNKMLSVDEKVKKIIELQEHERIKNSNMKYCFSSIYLIPEELLLPEDKIVYEKTSWCLNNWWSKKDVELNKIAGTDSLLIFSFNTLTYSPYHWFRYIVGTFPKLKFTIRYRNDGDMSAGFYLGENGHIVDFDRYTQSNPAKYNKFISYEYGKEYFELRLLGR